MGPGHAGILYDGVGPGGLDRYAFSFDFMAVGAESHEYATQVRELRWDEEGWPVVMDDNFFPMPSAS